MAQQLALAASAQNLVFGGDRAEKASPRECGTWPSPVVLANTTLETGHVCRKEKSSSNDSS